MAPKGSEALLDGTRADIIANLNAARARAAYLWPVLLTGGILTGLIAMAAVAPVFPILTALATLAAGLIASQYDLVQRNVVFAYQLDACATKTNSTLVKAMDALGKAQALWCVEAAGGITDLTQWKRHAGAASLVNKHQTTVQTTPPPGVQSNITPPSIMVDGKPLYLFPDCIPVRQTNPYGAVDYAGLHTATRPSRFIVETPVPTDCVIVDHTWAHPNKTGGPDRRFANNRQLPICRFEELGLISQTGLKVLILASARPAVHDLAAALTRIGHSTSETTAPDQILLSYAP